MQPEIVYLMSTFEQRPSIFSHGVPIHSGSHHTRTLYNEDLWEVFQDTPKTIIHWQDMASDASQLISLKNPVFRAYLYYCSILVLKVLGMVVVIGRQRQRKEVVRNPEDASVMKHLGLMKNRAKVNFDDEDVERPRRAHLNDLENIPFFFAAAFAYLLTDPAPWLAINLFRAFTWARIAHSLVYAVIVVPQPARVIAWGIGYGVTIYMCIATIPAVY